MMMAGISIDARTPGLHFFVSCKLYNKKQNISHSEILYFYYSRKNYYLDKLSPLALYVPSSHNQYVRTSLAVC